MDKVWIVQDRWAGEGEFTVSSVHSHSVDALNSAEKDLTIPGEEKVTLGWKRYECDMGHFYAAWHYSPEENNFVEITVSPWGVK